MRSISGLSKNWLKDIERILNKYLNAMKWEINEVETLKYIKKLQSRYSICGFRKMTYQIRKFLQHLKIDFADSIQPPKELDYTPVRITRKDIDETLNFFISHNRSLQINALINLGIDSGIRANELYQLKPENIDLDNRVVYINHKPDLNQTTKTGKSRVSFFTEKTRRILKEYLEFNNNGSKYSQLFSRRAIQNAFENAPIKVKHLRKYFSSEWERRNGNHQIKERLLGHSLKSIDSQHYSYLDTEEIKKVYDTVME